MVFAINIITFIIMNLFSIMNCKFIAARLGVLPCDSANQSDWLSVVGLHELLDVLEIVDFIYVEENLLVRVSFYVCSKGSAQSPQCNSRLSFFSHFLSSSFKDYILE
jgi:hypothetical protein